MVQGTWADSNAMKNNTKDVKQKHSGIGNRMKKKCLWLGSFSKPCFVEASI